MADSGSNKRDENTVSNEMFPGDYWTRRSQSTVDANYGTGLTLNLGAFGQPMTEEELRVFEELVGKSFQQQIDKTLLGENFTTASDQPRTALTLEALQEAIDRVNTLYSRKRGDLPDVWVVYKNSQLEVDQAALVERVVERNSKTIVFTSRGEFEVTDEDRFYLINIPKPPELRFNPDTLYGRSEADALRWNLRFGYDFPKDTTPPEVTP